MQGAPLSDSSSALAFTNWMPADFATLARSQALAEFESQFSSYAFLLVQVADASGPLAAALARTSTLPGPKSSGSDNIAYETTHCTEGEAMDLFAAVASPGGAESRFIVPVRAREGGGVDSSARIWVGRAFNNDIVLRDRTVSKCHAYFDYQGSGALQLKDAKSRNGTRVDGELIGSDSPFEVASGVQISFGSVHAELCSARELWRVLST